MTKVTTGFQKIAVVHNTCSATLRRVHKQLSLILRSVFMRYVATSCDMSFTNTCMANTGTIHVTEML